MSTRNNYTSVKPSLVLDFANAKSLDPRIDFNRNSIATYVGSNGLIKTARIQQPRLDHNPTTLEPKGLLIEDVSTNIRTNSEDTTAWGSNLGMTVTGNTTMAPDGAITADSWIENSSGYGSGFSSRWKEWSFSATNGYIYTLSAFVKPNGRRYVACYFFGDNNVFGGQEIWFDLQTGTVLSDSGVTSSRPTIDRYPNGWCRISASRQSGASSTGYFAIRFAPTYPLTSYTGDGSSGIYVWGVQVEDSGWMTSYIPTTGSTATRAKEYATMNGVNVTSWYNQRGGTWIGTSYGPSNDYTNGTNHHIFQMSPSNLNQDQSYQVRFDGLTGLTSWGSFTSVTDQWSFGPTGLSGTHSYTRNTRLTFGLGLEQNNIVFYRDGLLHGSDSSANFRTDISHMALGGTVNNGNQLLYSCIKKLVYYPERLSNEQIRVMTINT